MANGDIVESWQGDGVRVKTLKDWSGIDAFNVKGCGAQQWECATAFALGQVGKGYDYWAIIRFVDRRKMPENAKWFCSELVFAALLMAGVKLFDRIDAGAVSPGLLTISTLLLPLEQVAPTPGAVAKEVITKAKAA